MRPTPTVPVPPTLTADADGTEAPVAGRLVVVFLRGGMDGLSAVVPAGEAAYHDARPAIAVPADDVLPLDDRFGLHPALAPLHGLFTDGRLAVIHAVGNPAASRSHFAAQDLMEQGLEVRGADADGWAARHLRATGRTGLFDAVALSANLPASLRGSSALAIRALDDVGLRGSLADDDAASLRTAYAGDEPIERTGTSTLEAVDVVADVVARRDDPTGSTGPFADAATLLAADLDTRLVTIDLGGWDTHEAMGTPEQGSMAGLLRGLADDLAGFQADLDRSGQSDVTTLVMTEFGRRVAENGTGGLDHGWAGTLLALGGAVAGGRVLTDWPGLGPDELVRGDLAVSTDYRDVLWELVRDVLGDPDPSRSFPDHTHRSVGLTG